jgi:hypothetical protein
MLISYIMFAMLRKSVRFSSLSSLVVLYVSLNIKFLNFAKF